MTSDLRKQITAHKLKGFTPGDCYWRGATLIVEITPGNYVNENVTKRYGIKPREDVEYAGSAG